MKISDEKIEFALSCAKEASRIGGEVIKKYYFSGYDYEMKGLSDWVTEADRESESKIKEFLKENLPFDFLGEEFGEERMSDDALRKISENEKISLWQNELKQKGKIRWIVDPLDGTKNFMKRIPFFCVSIALCDGNTPLVGVVFSPLDEKMFWAVKGGGAFLNGEKISVSNTSELHSAVLGTGFPFRSRQFIELYLKSFQEFFMQGAGIRNFGSAALELCLVASGELDGFWELGLSPWDTAAAGLIIQEAGGKVADFWGGDGWLDTGCIVASNKFLFPKMLKITSEIFREI